MVENEIREAWARIDAWLEKKARRIRKCLAPGATDERIAALEARLGLALPEDVRASYRVHNGGEESDLFPSSEAEDMGYSLIPLEEIVDHWEGNEKYNDGYKPEDFGVTPGIKPMYWNPRWVPLATNGGGDYHCVDLDPAEGGTPGQVFEWLHETNGRRLLHPSWRAALEDLAEGLETRRYRYDPDCGLIRLQDRNLS